MKFIAFVILLVLLWLGYELFKAPSPPKKPKDSSETFFAEDEENSTQNADSASEKASVSPKSPKAEPRKSSEKPQMVAKPKVVEKPKVPEKPKKPPIPEEFAWLVRVKGKPINTRSIINLKHQLGTKKYYYHFKANEIQARLTKKEAERYQFKRNKPFQIVGNFYAGKVGTTIPPVYNGRVNVFIISMSSKKVVKKKTITLKQFCFT